MLSKGIFVKNLFFCLFFFVGLLYSADGSFEFEHIEKYLRANHYSFITQFERKYEDFFVRDLVFLIFVDHLIDESKLNQEDGILIFRDILLLRNKIEMQVLNEPEKAVFALGLLNEFKKIMSDRGFYLSRKSACEAAVAIGVAAAGAAAAHVVTGGVSSAGSAATGGAIGYAASQVAGSVAEATCGAIGSTMGHGDAHSGGAQYNPPFPEHMAPPGSGMVEPIRAIKNCPVCGSIVQYSQRREIFNILYR
jgi:hypothetical protein